MTKEYYSLSTEDALLMFRNASESKKESVGKKPSRLWMVSLTQGVRDVTNIT